MEEAPRARPASAGVRDHRDAGVSLSEEVAVASPSKPKQSRAERRAKMMRRVPKHTVNLTMAKYCVMARCATRLKWNIDMGKLPSKRCTMRWMDKWAPGDLVKPGALKQNHFAGMRELCTKCSLARNLNRCACAVVVVVVVVVWW